MLVSSAIAQCINSTGLTALMAGITWGVVTFVFLILYVIFMCTYKESPETYLRNVHVAEEYERLKGIYGEDNITIEKDDSGTYTIHMPDEAVKRSLTDYLEK